MKYEVRNRIIPPYPPFLKGGWGGFLLVFLCFLFHACSACPSREDEPTRVNSSMLTLKTAEQLSQPEGAGPNVRVINIGPSKEEEQVEAKGVIADVPSDVSMDSSLTNRLREKLKEAFSGKGGTPPDIEIYTGVMSLEAFSKYYEDRGYKIQRTSVPASQVIAPLLSEKPELSDRINISNYAGITINQIVVEGVNISAADKYIDPENYQVVYKTFVTITKTK